MANTYISLSAEQPQDITKLVYADISLDSVPAKVYLKQKYSNSQFIGALSADNAADTPDEDKIDYITNDTYNNTSGKMLFHNDIIPMASNTAYNDAARKKSTFKLEKNVNVIAVKRALHNIFTWTPGERILNPQFGSNLRKYLYEGITPFNKEQIMAEIRNCITEWEPRANLVQLVDLSNVQDTEENTVKIEIIYTIPSLTNEQFSYTYEQTVG